MTHHSPRSSDLLGFTWGRVSARSKAPCVQCARSPYPCRADGAHRTRPVCLRPPEWALFAWWSRPKSRRLRMPHRLRSLHQSTGWCKSAVSMPSLSLPHVRVQAVALRFLFDSPGAVWRAAWRAAWWSGGGRCTYHTPSALFLSQVESADEPTTLSSMPPSLFPRRMRK